MKSDSSLRSRLRKCRIRLLGPMLRRLGSRRYFDLLEDVGVHVSKLHYGEPIPDTRTLPEDLWNRPQATTGIDFNDARQLELLAQFAPYRAECDALPDQPTSQAHEYFADNGNYLGFDAAILHCMIRHFRPRRIIEIGSGYSTLASARAVRANASANPPAPCELVAIEPYPREMLRHGVPGLSHLIPKKLQEVPLEFFAALEANDILFIDSSHVLTIGGDVQREYLQIIPSLRPGVIVHVHDIFLPMEYPRRWIMESRWFWNEQYLLQAFLSFNREFEVLWAGAYMTLNYPDKLAAFSRFERALAQSFWMRRVR